MALNTEAIGKKIGPLTKEYTWKDAVLYALGVGAGFNELDYTYVKKLKVIPSFAIAMIFDLFGEITAVCNVNVAGILHGEQDLVLHNPIPPSGTMITEGKIKDFYDKGEKGALIVVESETFHSNGKKLFTSIITLFSRLDGGFGGKTLPSRSWNSRAGNLILLSTRFRRRISLSSTDSPVIHLISTLMLNLQRCPALKSRSCTDSVPMASPAEP
jgi:hypothetical protein